MTTVAPRGLLLGLVVITIAFTSACSEEDQLSGSLSDFYNTDFDNVRARLYTRELAIEYFRSNGEVPVRVTLRVRDDRPIQTGSYNLVDEGNITGRTGDQDIPPLRSGKLNLDAYGSSAGDQVLGTFDASFNTGEDTTSLQGEFDARLEVIPHVGGYVDDQYPAGQSCDNPIEGGAGGVFEGKIDERISDALIAGQPLENFEPMFDEMGNDVTPPLPDITCAEGLDRVIIMRSPRGGSATFDITLTGDLSATLYEGRCGTDEDGELACFAESGVYDVTVDSRNMYLVIEGTEGTYNVRIELPDPRPPMN